MGLVNLLADVGTEYRKLKFGNDRPGGGNSKQPFIQQDLPSLSEETPSTFPDFLLRDPKNQIDNRKDDLERVSKFLISREGGLFVAKQELLSLQNPIVPGQPNRNKPGTGLYNPLMTLAQVAGEGTGLHIEKQGLLPIFDNRLKYDYVYRQKSNTSFDGLFDRNRLTSLYLSISESVPKFDYDGINGYNLNRGGVNVLEYNGGPGSVLGIGKTSIRYAGDRLEPIQLALKTKALIDISQNKTKSPIKAEDLINRITKIGASQKSTDLKYISIDTGITGDGYEYNVTNQLFQNSVYTQGNTFPETNKQKTTDLGVYTFDQIQIKDQNIIGINGSTSLSKIVDFRKTIIDNPAANPGAANKLYSFNYTSPTVNIEQRIGIGNPGKRNRNRTKLNSYDNDTIDRINILPLYKDRVVLDPKVLTRDLLKFRFEIIDNQDPGAQTYVHFRAYLGTITDSYNAEWDGFRYVGRGDKFYNYQGFSRDISFTFQVAVQSRAEIKSIYQKLNYLASSLAPDYRNGYMKGNLVRLTIGDHFYSLPGFITTLVYTIPDNASWEIAFDSPEGGNTEGLMETSRYFDVQVSFTAIHDFIPRLNDNGGREVAFITNPTAIGGANQYMDDNKVYFFNNGAPGKNGKDFTNYYGPKPGEFINENNIDDINSNNLREYSSNGAFIEGFNETPITGRGLSQKPIPPPSTPPPQIPQPPSTPLRQSTDQNLVTGDRFATNLPSFFED